MFQFEFEIENTTTNITVLANTYREAMFKVKSAQIPALNIAELIMVRMTEIQQFTFNIEEEIKQVDEG